jgi:hypothetical protein
MLMAFTGNAAASDSDGMFPPEVHGWKPEGPDGLYDAGSLYDYIDGGAEVYRQLNVRAVRARRYVKEGSPEIIADLFEMESAADAFGAYHHDTRKEEPAGIGQESEYDSGALAYWKGRYFVSIISLDETPEARLAVLDLGRRVAEGIREEGSPPGLMRFLPEKDLLEAETRYFHTHLSLNRYYFVSERNPLNLGPGTEGLLARYRVTSPESADAPPYMLLLVAYPSTADAREALRQLREELHGDAGVEGASQASSGAWTGARVIERVLVAVLDAPSGAEGKRVLEEVAGRLRDPSG